MNKYLVTLSLVVDAVNDEHAEELTRQLAPSCGKVTTHLLGQTSPLAARPRTLNGTDQCRNNSPEVGEVELQLKLSHRETELLLDLCALQFEVLRNASINEGTLEYRQELAALQKLLEALQKRLEG